MQEFLDLKCCVAPVDWLSLQTFSGRIASGQTAKLVAVITDDTAVMLNREQQIQLRDWLSREIGDHE